MKMKKILNKFNFWKKESEQKKLCGHSSYDYFANSPLLNNENINKDLILEKINKYFSKKISFYDIDFNTVKKFANDINYLSLEGREYSKLAADYIMSYLTHADDKKTIKYFDDFNSFILFLNYMMNILNDDFKNKYFKRSDEDWGELLSNVDLNLDYFGLKTLLKNYLIKAEVLPKYNFIERPEEMYLRAAIAIEGNSLERTKQLFDLLVNGYISFGSPVYFNSGLKNQQLASCFLMNINDDSLTSIYSTLDKMARISKNSGGIGLTISNIRSKGTKIKGTIGESNGIVPMLKVINESSKYVDQGGGKRKGSIAIYLEPWHKDIENFLDIRKQRKAEELRCLDLFTALWVPDLFMKRVQEDKEWTLFCPSATSNLIDLYGEDFEKAYIEYENDNSLKEKGLSKTIKAKDLMIKIIESQIETGTPYMLYKDACNSKSNQKNLGTIKLSNLCAEIVEYTDKDSVAVCNLGSIALPKYVENGEFNYERLVKNTKNLVYYLNKIIDINYYPIEESKYSNLQTRPIGIGVQGLADVFFKLSIPYDSDEAKKINKKIFEHMYYGALEASCELAKKDGPYDKFKGSPASKGLLQFDLWNVKPTLDFSKLKDDIKKYGLRNSLLIALMPTASTAQILGNTESFEPQTSNLYKRQTLSGEHLIINNYLTKSLKDMGLWNKSIINAIICNKGSVQNLNIPEHLKSVYKTVWEIKQKDLIDMAADRAPYICQSQSMNLWFEDPSLSTVYSAHMYAWKKGLKTGSYYVRSRPARDAVQMTIDTCTACTL